MNHPLDTVMGKELPQTLTLPFYVALLRQQGHTNEI